MNNRGIISNNYLNFCKAESNQHIASEFAVLKLQELIESFQVKKILEVGHGIGAIAGSKSCHQNKIHLSKQKDLTESLYTLHWIIYSKILCNPQKSQRNNYIWQLGRTR